MEPTVVRKAPKPDDRKPSKVTEGGNTRPDAAWIEEVKAELHPPDESMRPAGFLYDVHYQWEGLLEDLNIEFFESFRRMAKGGEEPRRCNGTAYVRDASGMYVVDAEWARLTRPCLSRPARGTVVCHAHGSNIPQVKAAAQRVLDQASEIVALRLVGMTKPSEFVDAKISLAAMNSVLDRAGIRGGTQIEITGTGFEKVLGDLFKDEPTDGE